MKGASYSYTYKAFGSELGFITGLLLYFSYATAISAVALGFGTYLNSLTWYKYRNTLHNLCNGSDLCTCCCKHNGDRQGCKTDFVLVITKVAILAVFIVFALIIALSAKTPFTNILHAPTGGIGAIFAASVVIFFAYSGSN